MKGQSIVAVVYLILACIGINGSVIIDSMNQDHSIANELKSCKKYVNTSDYQQKNDFGVEDFQNEIKRDFNDEILFDVFIRGDQEARIILSERSVVDLLEPMYEIVIGNSDNTYTAIYRNFNDCLEEIYTPDVLWPDQFRKFTIQVTHAGFVRIYVGSSRVPLISAINLDPIFINYLVFSGIKTGENTSTEYYFDCGDDDEDITPIEVEKVTTIKMEAQNVNKATTHMHSFISVWGVICTSLLFQLLIRIR